MTDTTQVADVPTETEKGILIDLVRAPIKVTEARDDPEGALANLLTALEALGLIADNTTET
jgi:hypothetical protein